MKNMDIQELWAAACSGDNDTLFDYYAEGGEPNRRYTKFNRERSLISGAYRNGQTETVDLLLTYGETVMEHERQELREVYYRQVVLAAKALTNHFSTNNKNLTKKQGWLVDDLAAALAKLK